MSTESSSLGCYSGARALVLGGGGFIGRWVAAALSERGAQLVLAVRDERPAVALARELRLTCELRECDLSESGAAARLVREVRPEVVFDLAGYGVDPSERDEALARRLNADLVAEIADALEPGARWRGQALVHAGSALEFGAAAGDLADPWRCSPTTLYGRTKLEGSRRLRERSLARGLKALSARLFTVYGPAEHAGRLLPSLLAASRGSGPLPLTEGLQRRDFTYVGDVAEGLLRLGALEAELPQRALNLATGELASVRTFVETAARVLAIAPERLAFGALPTRAEEMAHDPVSVAELEARTGWRPRTTIEAGVRLTLAYEPGRRR
jgi:nucleoside-diphosphate-sugar epimerase